MFPDELDLKDIQTLLGIFIALSTISALVGGGVIVWIRWRLKDTFASKDDMAGLRGDVDKMGNRLEQVERGLADLPTHSAVATLRHGLANLQQQVPALAEKIDGQGNLIRGMDDRLGMVLDHLMKRSGS